MQVTLRDVAEQSGYSITTVSRALAGYSDVNERTREHIIATATTLGYQPNLLARQLRNRRTQTIGLIIPSNDQSFSNDFFSELLIGIGQAASRRQYDLLISAQVPGEEEMAAYRRIVAGNRVDGVLLARTRTDDPRIAYLQEQRIPFVVNGRDAPGQPSDFPYLDVDSQSAIRDAVTHLASLGHRHIGLVLPPPDIAYTGYRHRGYRDGLERAGIRYRESCVVYGDLRRSGGQAGADILLDRHPELTAFVACNDLMAIGIMNAVQRRGLVVGSDISVTGFDDIPAAEYAHPPLTTIRQPIGEIGQRLVELLLQLIDGDVPQAAQIMLPYSLVIRESSGAPKA